MPLCEALSSADITSEHAFVTLVLLHTLELMNDKWEITNSLP